MRLSGQRTGDFADLPGVQAGAYRTPRLNGLPVSGRWPDRMEPFRWWCRLAAGICTPSAGRRTPGASFPARRSAVTAGQRAVRTAMRALAVPGRRPPAGGTPDAVATVQRRTLAALFPEGGSISGEVRYGGSQVGVVLYVLACYCHRRMEKPGDFTSAFARGRSATAVPVGTEGVVITLEAGSEW